MTTKSLTACAIGLMASAANAALTLEFTNLTNNGADDIADQFSVDVTATGTDQITFSFFNSATVESVVKQVLFDFSDPMPFDLDDIDLSFASGTSDVGYEIDKKTGPLQGGNGSGVGFTTDASSTANRPAPKNGLNEAGDQLDVIFTLLSGVTQQSVFDLIAAGDIRVGLHVISIHGDYSDGFISDIPDGDPDPEPDTNPIPVPGAILMALLGLSSLRVLRR